LKLVKNILTDENFLFSEHTTYGLGGHAKVAYFPETEEAATEIFKFVNCNFKKSLILGNGSNVLASDEFYDGAVICTAKLDSISCNGDVLNCQSGVTVKKLLNFCVENGLSGLEYLAGIPASIGGLIYMNGGINCRHLGEDVLTVSIYDGNLRKISNENCDFGNKHSIMRDINAIILNVDLKTVSDDPIRIKKNIEYFLSLRKIQPKGKSCGCVFKNPKNLSAGRLIDEAGLKGLSFGGAYVSSEHANFIINNGATPNEIYSLIHEVKSRVYARFGITLDEEVIYIGEFNGTDG